MAILTEEQMIEAVNAEDFNKETFVQDVKDTLGDYKSKYTTKDQETLKWKGAMKNLGYDKDKFDNLDAFVESVKSAKQKAAGADDLSGQKSELEQRLALMETKLHQKEEAEAKLKADNERSKVEKKLTDAIGNKLKASKYVIKDLINDKKVKLVDGEVVFLNGDDVVLFDDGIKKVLEDNEDLLLADHKSGGNTKGNTKNTNNKSKLSVEQINKMSPEELQKNIAEIKKLGRNR